MRTYLRPNRVDTVYSSPRYACQTVQSHFKYVSGYIFAMLVWHNKVFKIVMGVPSIEAEEAAASSLSE